MKVYNQTAYNPNMNIQHRAQVLNDRILHFTINAIICNSMNYKKFISKMFTMLFCTMSSNDQNIRKNRSFQVYFNIARIHAENFLPFGNLKNLTPSKNTLQNLTVTNTIANIPNITTVRHFLPYGNILKGNTLQKKKIFEDPILTLMQSYSHCLQRQFTNVTNCTKFVTFFKKEIYHEVTRKT